MRLRIPTASTYQRHVSSSPSRSVWTCHRASLLVPLGTGHPGVEQTVGHEVEAVRDHLEVVQDLLPEGVAASGDVVELLEHREVDVGLDVAHDTGVAVPVPGPADAARLVDDADPLDAGLAELRAGEDSGDPPAHDDDIDVVDDGIALDVRREGVVAVAGEVLVRSQVADVRTAGYQSLVALEQVLGADGLRVVVRVRRVGTRHATTLGQVLISASGQALSRFGLLRRHSLSSGAPLVGRTFLPTAALAAIKSLAEETIGIPSVERSDFWIWWCLDLVAGGRF